MTTRCDHCNEEDALSRCSVCGGSYCGRHIGEADHDCEDPYEDDIDAEYDPDPEDDTDTDDRRTAMRADIDEQHKERHKKLHRALDELVADFIRHTGKLPSTTPLLELMQWSSQQCDNPTADAFYGD